MVGCRKTQTAGCERLEGVVCDGTLCRHNALRNRPQASGKAGYERVQSPDVACVTMFCVVPVVQLA
jgi:hypothetical protein